MAEEALKRTRPGLGRIVLYRLHQKDIKQALSSGQKIGGSLGADLTEGDECAAMIVQVVDGGNVNLQVFPDGNDQIWVRDAMRGKGIGGWRFWDDEFDGA